MKTSFWKVVFWQKLHRWLAYSLGAVFIVQGISGSLMVLGGPLDAWLNPDMVSEAPKKPLVEMANDLERMHPGVVGVGVKQQDEAGQLILGFWPEPDPLVPESRNYRLARISASSGEIVSVNTFGQPPQSNYDMLAYLYAIHSNLTLGAVGRFLLIFSTLGLLLLIVAGTVNFVNRRRAIQHKPVEQIVDSAAGKWHRRTGLLSGWVLAILLASGLALQYETLLDPSFSYVSEDRQGDESRLPLGAAWQAAEAEYPGAEARLIMAPFWPGGTFRIDLIPAKGPLAGETVELFLDAYSARVLDVRTDDNRSGIAYFVALLEPLHGGTILGKPGEAIAFIAGLLPLVMLPLGVVAVRRRRAARTEAASKKRD